MPDLKFNGANIYYEEPEAVTAALAGFLNGQGGKR